MKYIIELEKIKGTDLYRAKGANTLVFDEKGIQNILTPISEEPEIDWSKVAVDTPLQVSVDGRKWCNRYFCTYKNGRVYTWAYGRTSFSKLSSDDICSWNYARLPEVKPCQE